MGLNSITLQSNDSDVISGDIVGRINWAAASDGDGPVATSIAASISAVAEETFNDSNNATSLIFSTANDAIASEKLRITSDGRTVISNGSFVSNGDAQNSSYVLRTSTTNDTFTTIANNGSSIRLSNNRTFMFTANIVARRTNGQDNAAYKLEGIIANDGYGASILGTPVKTILYESDSSWDVQAIIVSINVDSDTSDDLLIQGKGAASKNVNWVCKLDLLEVGGDISGYTETNTQSIAPDAIP